MSAYKVDFICIVAPKFGSTWLWCMLRQQPALFLPKKKEIHYFNRDYVCDPSVENPNYSHPVQWYLEYFSVARPRRLCGGITPYYLRSATAAADIHAHKLAMKIIVMVKNLVGRGWSDYFPRKQTGWLVQVVSLKNICKEQLSAITGMDLSSCLMSTCKTQP